MWDEQPLCIIQKIISNNGIFFKSTKLIFHTVFLLFYLYLNYSIFLLHCFLQDPWQDSVVLGLNVTKTVYLFLYLETGQCILMNLYMKICNISKFSPFAGHIKQDDTTMAIVIIIIKEHNNKRKSKKYCWSWTKKIKCRH